tara:strand:+ start:2500 stop:2775 length:276 start_codon:yes stop_codon:yes gene_type:complete
MSLAPYNMNDLLLLIVGVATATATLCLALQRSKCESISILYGCWKCSRDTKAIIEEQKLKLGRSISKESPKVKTEPAPNLDLTLKEPEPEP